MRSKSLCGMTHEWHYSTDPSFGDLIVEVQDSLWPLATFYRSPRGISTISTRGIRSLARQAAQLAPSCISQTWKWSGLWLQPSRAGGGIVGQVLRKASFHQRVNQAVRKNAQMCSKRVCFVCAFRFTANDVIWAEVTSGCPYMHTQTFQLHTLGVE